MRARIVVAHPRQAGAKRSCADVWAYADENLEIFDKVAHALDGLPRLVEAAELQDEARRLLPKFIPWADDQIPLDDPRAWLLSPCHRNPFGNNLFLHIVWLTLIKRHLDDRILLVLTESSGLARTLQALCEDHKWEFLWVGRSHFLLKWVSSSARAWAALGRDIIRMLVSMLSARALMGPTYLARFRDVKLFVDTYIFEDSIDKDGLFHGNYFPGLVEWCRDNQISVAIYPFLQPSSLCRLPSLFVKMRQSIVPMLPFERVLIITDVLGALVACLKYAFRRQHCTRICEIDVTNIVEGDGFNYAMRGLIPNLMLLAPKRLVVLNIKPMWLYEWFENQAVDRANAFAFRDIGCEVIALRPYHQLPLFANLYTSERQSKSGTCPKNAWVAGAAMRDLLIFYDNRTEYSLMPALRYSHLFSSEDSGVEGDKLLLLLTHSPDESLNIISCVFPIMDSILHRFSNVLIKPHIGFNEKLVRNTLYKLWPDLIGSTKLHWESRQVSVLLNEARLVVTAGSGSALEAICRGVPVVVVGRKAGLDMNPLQEIDHRLWCKAYNADQMMRIIINWSPSHPVSFHDRRILGKKIRDRYFVPTDASTMARLDPRKPC